MAKFVTKTLKETLNLRFTYNIKNSIQLIEDLNTIPINENTRICSFDVKDMYTNIPQQDATHIIHNILLKNEENMADDINILQTILLCRVHDISCTRQPFTNAAYWKCSFPPFSYPLPFPTFFPALGCSSELKTTTVQNFVRETFPGNSVWLSF
jgi:hypothetical protein